MTTIEFLAEHEAEAPDVRWSGQANDDSVLILVKMGSFPGEYLLLWYVTCEWQRVDGSERQWMFEWDAERSQQFGTFSTEEAAVEAAEGALTEHCGEEWS